MEGAYVGNPEESTPCFVPSEVESIGGTAHISLSAGAVGTAGAEAVVGMTGAGSFGMSCSRSWARVSSSPRMLSMLRWPLYSRPTSN